MGLKQLMTLILVKGNKLTLEQCVRLHNIGFNITWNDGKLSSVYYAE